MMIRFISSITALAVFWLGTGFATAEAADKPQAQILQVYKSATCGCCNDWIAHMRANAFTLNGNDLANLTQFKLRHGIELRYQSCHTAVTPQGFVFEGHIPARFVNQFLAEPPSEAIGLAVPGMPVGSPGMEVGDKFMPYQVLLLKRDGNHEIYAAIRRPEQQY